MRFAHKVKTLCQVLGVSRSTYYKHLSSVPSLRTLENQELRSKILSLYSASKKRLGAYKLCHRLSVEYGISISPGRVYRLMKQMQLPKMSTCKPTYKQTATQNDANLLNVLNQRFNPEQPNLVWASDITYVKTQYGFCYLCVIIDLFARKVIAYRISKRMDTSLVISTFQLALTQRDFPKGVLFHSDRGAQFTSFDFRKVIDLAEFVQSFSAKGHPFDNAVVEAFFKYLKKEELNRRTFSDISDVKLAVFEYIERFYNSSRPHSSNSMLSPNEKEDLFFQS